MEDPKITKTTTPALIDEPQKSTNDTTTPLPLLKGTLSYHKEKKQHKFSGMWKYENSNSFAPQRFELVRNLGNGEELSKLTTDGIFHGSFSVIFTHTNKTGKKKEKSTVITERDVHINFTKLGGTDNKFKVMGRGSNRFGTFQLTGHCEPSQYSDEEMQVELYKKYIPILPPPTPVTNDTVVLRGKLYKTTQKTDYEAAEVIWKVEGQWSSSLNFLNTGNEKLINPFEYTHTASDRRLGDSQPFEPEGGRYVGWFLLNNENGTKSKIQEKDVTLKFRKNSQNGWNVEGKGSNAFGKYTITGTLDAKKNILEIFRHFSRVSKPPKKTNLAPVEANLATLKLEDVVCPAKGEVIEALKSPDAGTYAAISRGILRLNTLNNSITCSGKWALTKEHFTNNLTSNFGFGCDLEPGHGEFPVDGANYRGNFKLKRGATKYQQITDQQIVLKFRKNTTQSYNVYGKGVNSLGEFSLQGILIVSGKASGQLELYRSYTTNTNTPTATTKTPKLAPPPTTTTTTTARGRATKLPAKLADDNRCSVVLCELLDMDVQQWFSFPVDPVALNVPGYFSIITNPMDLTTIKTKLATGDLPEAEFCRLVRLVYNNAIKFNENPTHPVHSAAKLALEFFDKKFPSKKRGRKANLADVPSNEYEKLLEAFCSIKGMFNKMKEQLNSKNVDTSAYAWPTHITPYSAATPSANLATKEPEVKKSKKTVEVKPAVVVAPPAPPEPEPLTLKEQEQLTNAINKISEDKLLGVINIIKEHQANLANPSDSDEIDLEIDALSVTTQRKLWQFVMKHVKKPKKKKPKTPKPAPAAKLAPEPTPPEPKEDAAMTTHTEDDFGDFGDFGDGNDDEEDDQMISEAPMASAWNAMAAPTALPSQDFDPNTGAAQDNDAWDLARSEAQKRNKMELEKKEREAKLLADAELNSEKRLTEAKMVADQALAEKLADRKRLEDIKLQEEEKLQKEAHAAREKARREREAVQQVVDLDAQRMLMSQYEYGSSSGGGGGAVDSSGDGNHGGASPSSDFGF